VGALLGPKEEACVHGRLGKMRVKAFDVYSHGGAAALGVSALRAAGELLRLYRRSYLGKEVTTIHGMGTARQRHSARCTAVTPWASDEGWRGTACARLARGARGKGREGGAAMSGTR
jgi:hypothetical protein